MSVEHCIKLTEGITMTSKRTDEDYNYICDALYKYNLESVSGLPDVRTDINFVMKDGDKAIGGIFCNTFNMCMYVDVMWLEAAYRGRGYGRLMISRAEESAREKGCVFVHTCTFSYQSPEFYKACGYEVFAELRDYPNGIVQYFLKKKL